MSARESRSNSAMAWWSWFDHKTFQVSRRSCISGVGGVVQLMISVDARVAKAIHTMIRDLPANIVIPSAFLILKTISRHVEIQYGPITYCTQKMVKGNHMIWTTCIFFILW